MKGVFHHEQPFVCADAVIFTLNTQVPDSYRKLPETELRLLLYKRKTEPYCGKWCLPGGFLHIDETPEDNIRRKIFEKSQDGKCWLEQLYTFCDQNRDPRARVISIAYLGLMNEAQPRSFESGSAWFTVQTGPNRQFIIKNDDTVLSASDLSFDHFTMIKTAIERLQSKIIYTGVIFNLLPEEFTLTQLQNAYEAILGKKDQAANFRRKIIDMVQETDRFTSDKGHRPAKIYIKKTEVECDEKAADRNRYAK